MPMEPLTFEWTAPRRVRVPFAAPLTCADLARGDLDRLSYFGAHHSLRVVQERFGMGEIHYRQFSDWQPGGPLFTRVLTLSASDGTTTLEAADTSDYEWRPDYIQRKGRLGDWLEVLERTGYADAQSISSVLWIKSRASKPLKLRLSGEISANARAAIAPVLSLGGVRVDIQASLPNPWNASPSELKCSFWIASDLRDARIHVDGNRYALEFDLKAGGFREIELAFCHANGGAEEDRAEALITESVRELNKSTNRINLWLSSVQKPSLQDEPRLRAYYRAWFDLWANAENPEGYWIRPIISPNKLCYGREIRLWDSALHIFALLRGGPEAHRLAEDQIRVLIEGAKLVGHLPREIWVGAVSPEIQAPGALSLAAMEIFRKTGNRQLLSDIYRVLADNNGWFYQNKDSDKNGLCEWAGDGSGWTDSPRWDQGEVDAVDLNCWLCLDQRQLAEMARVLGLREDARRWDTEAKRTADLIRTQLWDEEAGCFFDRNPRTGERVRILTPAAFWALMAGVATKQQAARMVMLLKDPNLFATPYPIPSVAQNESPFNPDGLWRGAAKPSLNWMTIMGLERYGYRKEAGDLLRKTLDLIAMSPIRYESYNPLTGTGLGEQDPAWTGALYILMASR